MLAPSQRFRVCEYVNTRQGQPQLDPSQQWQAPWRVLTTSHYQLPFVALPDPCTMGNPNRSLEDDTTSETQLPTSKQSIIMILVPEGGLRSSLTAWPWSSPDAGRNGMVTNHTTR